MKKKCLLFLVLFMGTFLVKGFAQSSERMSSLIKNKTITNGQASYLAASYLGLIQDEDSDQQAFDQLAELGYFSAGDEADSVIDYGTLSFIYAKALNLKGGIFYSIFHSKRYAFNELKAKGIIPSDCDPSDKVSGRDSIAVFSLCMDLTEGSK